MDNGKKQRTLTSSFACSSGETSMVPPCGDTTVIVAVAGTESGAPAVESAALYVNVSKSPAIGAFAPLLGVKVTIPVVGLTATVPFPAGETAETDPAATLRTPPAWRETLFTRTEGVNAVGATTLDKKMYESSAALDGRTLSAASWVATVKVTTAVSEPTDPGAPVSV